MKKIFVAFFVLALLALLSFGNSSVYAQASTATATATWNWHTPPYTPTAGGFNSGLITGTPVNFSCPTGNPQGYGTLTPGAGWVALCGQCIQTLTPTAFVFANFQTLVSNEMTAVAAGTILPGSFPTSAPVGTVTVTPTVSPTATAAGADLLLEDFNLAAGNYPRTEVEGSLPAEGLSAADVYIWADTSGTQDGSDWGFDQMLIGGHIRNVSGVDKTLYYEERGYCNGSIWGGNRCMLYMSDPYNHDWLSGYDNPVITGSVAIGANELKAIRIAVQPHYWNLGTSWQMSLRIRFSTSPFTGVTTPTPNVTSTPSPTGTISPYYCYAVDTSDQDDIDAITDVISGIITPIDLPPGTDNCIETPAFDAYETLSGLIGWIDIFGVGVLDWIVTIMSWLIDFHVPAQTYCFQPYAFSNWNFIAVSVNPAWLIVLLEALYAFILVIRRNS